MPKIPLTDKSVAEELLDREYEVQSEQERFRELVTSGDICEHGHSMDACPEPACPGGELTEETLSELGPVTWFEVESLYY